MAELADARRKALVPVLANLVARWMVEREWHADRVDDLDASDLVNDAEIATVWRLYLAAFGESRVDDVAEDERDRDPDDRVLRLAIRWGFSALDATRAARGDLSLRKVDVEDDADYKRATRVRRAPKPRSPRPRSLRSFGEVMTFQRAEVLAAIRDELLAVLRDLRR